MFIKGLGFCNVSWPCLVNAGQCYQLFVAGCRIGPEFILQCNMAIWPWLCTLWWVEVVLRGLVGFVTYAFYIFVTESKIHSSVLQQSI